MSKLPTLSRQLRQHQHRKIACLEEIAYLNGWITKDDVLKVYELLKKNQYGQYLKDVLRWQIYRDAVILKEEIKMTIIVTGGAGFIGSNFIFHMLKQIPGLQDRLLRLPNLCRKFINA